MSITINLEWDLEKVDYKDIDGLIIKANWALHGYAIKEDGAGRRETLRGEMEFERGDSFTPLDDITKDDVISWVKTGLGNQLVTQLEQQATELANNIYPEAPPPEQVIKSKTFF